MPVKFDASDAINKLEHLQSQGIPQSIEDTLNEAADQVIQLATSIVPVDTGNLRDSIRILEQGDGYVIVGSDVEYAVYVEFGTAKMEAQPYLSPALDDIVGRFSDILLGYLESELD